MMTNITAASDDHYHKGYNDGKAGEAIAIPYMNDPNYMMGYEDGRGDRENKIRPVDDIYNEMENPPEGFNWANSKEVPLAYEYYLSKNGTPTFMMRERLNRQRRHILMCATCGSKTACHHHPEVRGRD